MDRSSSSVPEVDVVREEGVGDKEMLMTYSIPARHIASIISPLKKSTRIDFNWMNRGCVSKSSDAKCINGRLPGVDLGVCSSK